MRYKVIITGANGLIGEGVLLQCLENQFIEEILVVGRWEIEIKHPKVKELLIPDFLDLDDFDDQLKGYDVCFYCANITSVCLEETIYNHITFEIAVNFAVKLLLLNPNLMFNYLSDIKADRTGRSSFMQGRIKGKTENALNKLTFKRIHHFRIGLVKPLKVQQKGGFFYKTFMNIYYPIMKLMMPNKAVTMKELALAMINVLLKEYPERTVNAKDIRYLAQSYYGIESVANKLAAMRP